MLRFLRGALYGHVDRHYDAGGYEDEEEDMENDDEFGSDAERGRSFIVALREECGKLISGLCLYLPKRTLVQGGHVEPVETTWALSLVQRLEGNLNHHLVCL